MIPYSTSSHRFPWFFIGFGLIVAVAYIMGPTQ